MGLIMDIRAKLFCICPKCFKNLPKYFENGCFLDITGRKKYICPKYCIIEERSANKRKFDLIYWGEIYENC